KMRSIKRWIRRSPKKIRTITTNQGKILRCSGEHLVMTVDQGWIAAKDLKVGMSLLSPVNTELNAKSKTWNTNFPTILKIEDGLLYEDTYDLEIENTHNFVANGILVHNCNR